MADVFVSYSHKNEIEVNELVRTLERMQHNVHYDRDYSGGQIWWDAILQDIRDSKIFIIALSYEYSNSTPCASEYKYARDLSKEVLPVMVRQVNYGKLPAGITLTNAVDFTNKNKGKILDLSGALTTLDKLPLVPLPDPLPSPPLPPISRVNFLLETIEDPSIKLTSVIQKDLLSELLDLYQQRDMRESARYAIEKLRQRPELDTQFKAEIDRLLRKYRFSSLWLIAVAAVLLFTMLIIAPMKPIIILLPLLPREVAGEVTWSKDGKLAITSSGGTWLYFSDMIQTTGPFQLETPPSIPLNPPWTTGAAFSPDGKLLAVGSNDDKLRVWDATIRGNQTNPLYTLSEPGMGWVRSVAFSPDGTRIAAGSWNSDSQSHMGWVWEWEWDASASAYQLLPFSPLSDNSQGYVYSVAFSPDGTRIASDGDGPGDGSASAVHVWDATNGTLLIPPLVSFAANLRSVAFSPDSKLIVAGGWSFLGQGKIEPTHEVFVWDANTYTSLPSFTVSGMDRIETIAFSPNGKCLVSGGDDGIVRVWDTTNANLLYSFSLPSSSPSLKGVFGLGYSVDGERVAAVGRDGTVLISWLPCD